MIRKPGGEASFLLASNATCLKHHHLDTRWRDPKRDGQTSVTFAINDVCRDLVLIWESRPKPQSFKLWSRNLASEFLACGQEAKGENRLPGKSL